MGLKGDERRALAQSRLDQPQLGRTSLPAPKVGDSIVARCTESSTGRLTK